MLVWRFSHHDQVVPIALQLWIDLGKLSGREDHIWLSALAQFGTLGRHWTAENESLVFTIHHREKDLFVLCVPGMRPFNFPSWDKAADKAEELAGQEEHLVLDPRADMTPAQHVSAKLASMGVPGPPERRRFF